MVLIADPLLPGPAGEGTGVDIAAWKKQQAASKAAKSKKGKKK